MVAVPIFPYIFLAAAMQNCALVGIGGVPYQKQN